MLTNLLGPELQLAIANHGGNAEDAVVKVEFFKEFVLVTIKNGDKSKHRLYEMSAHNDLIEVGGRIAPAPAQRHAVFNRLVKAGVSQNITAKLFNLTQGHVSTVLSRGR